MLTRSGVLVVPSVVSTVVGDCSTGMGSTGTLTGSIIDRLGLGRNYRCATVFLIGEQTGTTFINKKLTIDYTLQAGASSGGGDMATFTGPSELNPSAVVWGSSAYTTDMRAWTTGSQRFYGPDLPLDINGAGRFLRILATVTTPGNTTSTATSPMTVMGGVAFSEPDVLPVPTGKMYVGSNVITSATTT